MAVAENGHQDVVDEVGIADDDFGNLIVHAPEVRLKRIHVTLKIRYEIAHGTKVISTVGLKPAGIAVAEQVMCTKFLAANCADDADGPHSHTVGCVLPVECGPSASSAQFAAKKLSCVQRHKARPEM